MAAHKKRGRPPKSLVTRFRAICWFYAVSEASGLKSADALDQVFVMGTRPSRVEEDAEKRRPCKFSKYRRGISLPEKALVERVGELYPETKELFYHPFWALCEPAITDPDHLHRLIDQLPKPFQEVELYTTFDAIDGFLGIGRQRDELDWFAAFGGIEALSACLAFVHLSRLHHKPGYSLVYSTPTIVAFERMFAFPPFEHIRSEFRAYLFSNFLNDASGAFHLSPESTKKLDKLRRRQPVLNSIIRSLGILSHHDPPTAGLFLVERIVPEEVIRKYERRSLKTRDDWFRSLPEAEKLRRALRPPEKKKGFRLILPSSR